MAGSSSKIPIEIISDEEMVSIAAALATAAFSPVTPAAAVPARHSFTSVTQIHRTSSSIQSVPVKAKRRLFTRSEPDIEDYGTLLTTRKKFRAADTLLHRFRSKRGLFVSDVTKTEVSIEADFATAACSPVTPAAAVPARHSFTSVPQIHRTSSSSQSVPVKAKRRLFTRSEPDIEDYGTLLTTRKKKFRAADTLLHRFRSKRGLFVSDVTNTEWCEKQMEFSLFSEEWKNNETDASEEWRDQKQTRKGRRKSEAMKAGIDRHVQLQQEIHYLVDVDVKSCEDAMALKLVNFINGVNQLLFEGLTRVLPIVSFDFTHGIWMVGRIDEVRMPKAKNNHKPVLVETKTRYQDTVPSEPQKRKGRIQLMCYKYLWDNLVAHADHDFPSKQLFDYFELNPRRRLCKDLQRACADSGISALTLNDVVRCYQNTCKMLPLANNKLVLTYESQRDHSVLHEEKIAYKDGWIKNEIQSCLEFWLGEREASYVVEEEQWKCGYCDFASECPAYIGTESSESLSEDDSSDCSEM